MLTGLPVQTLRVSAVVFWFSRASVMAWVTSLTCMKSLVCRPSPCIVKVSLVAAALRSFVMTPLYGLLALLGPYTLKGLRMIVLRAYDVAKAWQ